MRNRPKSFSEFVEKYDLTQSDLTFEGFTERAQKDIIFRNDFAFISLLLDLNKLESGNQNFGLDTPVASIFPDSKRVEKWESFRELTNLDIPDLEPRNAKSCFYILIVGVGVIVGLYLIFTNQDLSFFTMLHPEIFGMGFIAIIISIVGIDYFAKKMRPDDKIPYSINSEKVEGFVGRVLTYNRHKIKAEFTELYADRFEKTKADL